MKAMKSILLLALLAAGACAQVSAQMQEADLANGGLTALIQYARENNPDLIQAREKSLAADQRVRSAGVLPDPMITYGYFLEPVATRLGPQEQKISLVQNIPWLTKLGLKRQMARYGVSAAEQQYLRQLQQLQRDVKAAWYEYRYLFAAMAVTRENQQLLEQAGQVVRTASGAGTVSQAAVLRIQMKMEELDNSLLRLTELRLAQQGRLNALLNRDLGAPLPIPQAAEDLVSTQPGEARSFVESAAELVASIATGNPEYRATAAETEKAQAAVNLANQSYFPDLTLGIHYIQTGDAMDPAMTGSGRDPLLATVSFGLPLWPGNHGARREEARHTYAAAVARQNSLANNLQQKLESVLVDWRDAQRQVTLYQDKLVPLAQQIYRITSAEFATGQEDYLSLLSAQRELLGTQLALHRVIANRDQNRAEIERLVGGDLN